MRLFSICFTLLLLTGCVNLLPASDLRQAIIRLTPQVSVDDTVPSVSWGLTIMEPSADATLRSNLILVQDGLPTVQYVMGAVWSDALPDLWRSLTVDAFLSSNKILNVSTLSEGFTPTYGLATTIQDFALQAGANPEVPPTAVIKMTCQLVSFFGRKIISMTHIVDKEPCASRQTSAVGEAFNRLTARVLQKMLVWALLEGQKNQASLAQQMAA